MKSTGKIKTLYILSLLFTALIAVSTLHSSQKAKSDNKSSDNRQEALKKEKAGADSIEKILKFGLHSERREAVRRVLSIKDKSVQNRLARVLTDLLKTDDDSEVTTRTITVLGEIEYQPAKEAIARHLSNENEDTKIAAVYALARLKADSYAPRMIEKLKKQEMTEDSNFTESLIITLGDFKAAEIYDFAEEKINDPKTTGNIKEQLVLMLGKLNIKKPKELLLKIFKDEQESITLRSYAVNSLARLELKEVIPDINEVMNTIDSYNFKKKSQYHTLQLYSLAALARLGDKAIIPRLQESLKSDNASMRIRAISLLKELNDKTSIDILKYRMDNDPETRVRKAAREALKEMGVDVEDEVELHKDLLDKEPEM